MENYLEKLLSLRPEELDPPQAALPYGEFLKLLPINDPLLFGRVLRDLAKRLPFATASWPSFGIYFEEVYMVKLTEFRSDLLYCERGGTDLRRRCANRIDLAYEILRIAAPDLTPTALPLAQGLDHLADQRLLIWLRMSSAIHHMFQVNEVFGLRAAAEDVQWMCAELVRMGVFADETQAFEDREVVQKGLTLSGMPAAFAGDLLRRLAEA
jgi:hypothetical protein